jgi:hypothetical protein
MGRLGRITLPRRLVLRVGLPLFAFLLTAVGFWVDRQFAASRGPLRPVGAEIVIWISVAAVGLVLVLWLVAARTTYFTSKD